MYFEPSPKLSQFFCSASIAAAVPLVLAAYWFLYGFAPETSGVVLRVTMLACAFSLAFLWHSVAATRTEIRLVAFLGIAAVLLLAPAVMASNPVHALTGWVKSLVLFVFCCMLSRGLRHPFTARALGYSLLIAGAALVVFILLTYFRHLGFSLPTYKSTREFKGIEEAAGVSLNSIAFAAVLSYLAGLCLVRPGRAITAVGIPLFIASSLFSGSRAPLMMLAASGFTLLCINGLRSRFLVVWIATAILALGAVGSLAVIAVMAPDAALTQATEGRWHLWSVGLHKFTERPVFGYGYESWREDLVSRLPGEYSLTLDLATKATGAYHNEYVDLLAEEGVFGIAEAALIAFFVLRLSWLLAFHAWRHAPTSQLPLFVCLFLLLRANFEAPGFFGYGQDPVDYLAYIVLAILVSRFSIEEDAALSGQPDQHSYIRLRQSHQPVFTGGIEVRAR